MKMDKYRKQIQKELDGISEKQNARAAEIETLTAKRNAAQSDEKAARENQHGAMISGDDALFHKLRDDEREASDRVELCSRRIAMLSEPLFTEDEAHALIDKMHDVTESAVADAEKETAALLKKIIAIGEEAGTVVDAYDELTSRAAESAGGIAHNGFNRSIYGMFDLLAVIERVQKRKPASGIFK